MPGIQSGNKRILLTTEESDRPPILSRGKKGMAYIMGSVASATSRERVGPTVSWKERIYVGEREFRRGYVLVELILGERALFSVWAENCTWTSYYT